ANRRAAGLIIKGKQWRRQGRGDWKRLRQGCPEKKEGCPPESDGIHPSAATSVLGTLPTGQGSIKKRRFGGRVWSSCLRQCSKGKAKSTFWLRRLRRWELPSRMCRFLPLR